MAWLGVLFYGLICTGRVVSSRVQVGYSLSWRGTDRRGMGDTFTVSTQFPSWRVLVRRVAASYGCVWHGLDDAVLRQETK